MLDLPVSENIEWIQDKFFELSGMTIGAFARPGFEALANNIARYLIVLWRIAEQVSWPCPPGSSPVTGVIKRTAFQRQTTAADTT